MQSLLDTADLLLEILPQQRINSRQRLIQQQYFRFSHDGACQSYPLLLATGQLRRIMVLFTGQANELDHAGDFFFDQTRIHFLHLQTKCDVLRYIHVREQRVLLKDHSDIPFPRR